MNLNGPPFTFRDALQTASGALELLFFCSGSSILNSGGLMCQGFSPNGWHTLQPAVMDIRL